ncbi:MULTISPECIES: alkaline phosphatase family protein [unclassified Polaribacter]|uniref:alkaline phosphatase family protein n=1 Tax=unclassified Polaribacter TaxID=196858 RepID=UPI0011BD8306|nr:MULTISPECIES: ectonucleotide pyrophosphatase/phosphodiesterase [unclassified Polaribacter]TXD51383.1 alkaline phosphatase family protein [Polaribacter sp. IC063]TXD62312.1 alkaline phosphatase family protein [Polaribacter sp. IC066]
MKKTYLWVVFIFIGFQKMKAQEKSVSKHVILISVDGFRPDFYQEAKWPVPNLKNMTKEGVSANGVRGVFPSVTYPSHTTLITGAFPATHGIYYNSPFETKGQTGKWYWESNLIQTETLWGAVRKAGKKSASLIWPVSVGAPVDYNIPEVWTLDKSYGRIAPMREHQTPKGLLEEMETEVLGKMNIATFNGDNLSREDRTGEMAGYILGKYKPNLMTIHLIATDHFQHEQGRNGKKVHTAIAAVDRAIGKIMEAAEQSNILDKTTFIITGDHGFVDIHSALNPNIWLVEEGLMEAKENRGNWKATFHTQGASAFLHLKDQNDLKTLTKIREKLKNLPNSVKKLFRVVEKNELDSIGADPTVVLALNPIPGVAMSGAVSGAVVTKRTGGTHGYFPDFHQIETGFVAWGAGISEGKIISKMGIEDIAPIISALLHLNFKTKDGILYPGILKD